MNTTPRSRFRQRSLGLAAVVVTAALALAGCASSSGDSASGDAASSTVTVALTDEPSSLDPLFDTNLPALNVFYNVFDQLATTDATGAVVPRLSTAWTKSYDLKTWVLTLRDDAKFSDATVTGRPYTLTRNDSYWGTKGEFQTVVFTPVPDETTRANSVQSGDLDIALLGPSQVRSVKASGTVDVVEQQSNRVLYTGFNAKAKAKWLDDPNIRTFGFDHTNAATTFDLAQAKSLIAASGYDGSAIPLSYPTTGLPQIDQIAQAIGGYLTAAGLNVTLDGEESSTYSGARFSASLPGIFLFAFAPSVMDADLPLTILLKTGGQGYISDAEIDRLLTEQVGDADNTSRAADIASISKIVNENTYYAPNATVSRRR
ncbi:ABC transporter substrate-binding protein [Subtercola boreus]|nr:ABC transporter substrate-binding protein [Subtercola boreus]